jgi:bacteriocin-like protein
MSQDDSKQDRKAVTTDALIKPTETGNITLTEEELSRVSGGRKAGGTPLEYLKITMEDLIVS